MTKILITLFCFISTTTFTQIKNLSFDVFLGSGYRNLLYNSEDEILVMQAQTRRNEKSAPNNVFTISTEFSLNENLVFKTGIGFSNFGYTRQDLKDLRWPSEITSKGFVFDPSLPHSIKSKQFLQYLELPLLIQFKSDGNRLKFYSSAGFINQYMIRVKAINETDIGKEIKSGKPVGINKYNLMYDFELGTQIKVVNNINFKIGFNYGSQLLALEDKSISEKLFRYGVKTSVQYVF